jgi:hypothetical protein
MANALRNSRRTVRANVEAAPVEPVLAIVEAAPEAVEAAPLAAFPFPKASDFEAAPEAVEAAPEAVEAAPESESVVLAAFVASLTTNPELAKAFLAASNAPKAERKSNSEGVKASWLVAATRAARLKRDSVILSVNGAAPIGYDSFPKAFDENGKPGGAGKFTKNRLELKEKGTLTLVNEEGTTFRFDIVTAE